MAKATTPASRKAKGRRFQQWVRDRLLELSDKFRSEDIKSTSMGVPGEDVQLSPFVRDVLPIQIECKNISDKRLPVQSYMEQARTHGKYTPVVFVKQPYKEPLVIIEAKHYLELQEERIKRNA